MKKITIYIDGNPVEVSQDNYIKAKTRQLVEFGYTTLTEEITAIALNNAIESMSNPKAVFDEHAVITAFILQDIKP